VPPAFLSLLMALVAFLVVGPFLVGTGLGAIVDQVLFSGVLVAAVALVRADRKAFVVAVALALVTFGLGWAALLTPHDTVVFVWLLSLAGFLGFVIVSLLSAIFRARRVVTDTVLGAVCVYLLLGVAWGLGFALLELALPGSFRGLDEHVAPGRLHGLLYYSLTTVTTLSSGDIAPLTPPARILSVLETVTGQFYLTVLISRLVGLQISQSSVA
jgi:voltage-gated potassium channel